MYCIAALSSYSQNRQNQFARTVSIRLEHSRESFSSRFTSGDDPSENSPTRKNGALTAVKNATFANCAMCFGSKDELV